MGDLLVGIGGIYHPEDNVCLVEFLEGSFDTDTFDCVMCFADAGGVDETECDSSDIDRVFDDVTGRTVDIADNRFVLVQQDVQQG